MGYESCSGCTSSHRGEVVFHSHVSQFDQLVKLIAIIGQHFKTHSNICVVVVGEPLTNIDSKNQDPLNHIYEPEIKSEFNSNAVDDDDYKNDLNKNEKKDV